MRNRTLLTGLALAAIAAPLAAEMTHAEMELANKCKRLTPEAMQRDERCVALMKRYPEAMTKSPDMMSPQPPR
jgi:hypothetical protein